MNTLGRITLSVLLITSVAAPAQEDAPELPPRYAVEVLVFRHLDQTRSTTEVPPPRDPFARGPAVQPGPRVDFLLIEPVHRRPPALAPLAGEDRSLAGAWGRLQRLDAYEPLAYLSWSQPAPGQAMAAPFSLEEIATLPAGLTGNVTLYKERFLHLALDLNWQETAPVGAGTADKVAPRTNQISESRRLRGDQVQYFDNPRFGAIAYVQELERPETEEPAPLPAG